MYATNYFEQAILNLLRDMSMTAPATVYIALYFSSPGETGQAGLEVSYPGYTRKPITFSAPANMHDGIGIQNTEDITFAESSIAVGIITHFGITDSLIGGNVLLYAELTDAFMINSNEAPVVVAGEAQWWLTGDLSSNYKIKILNILRGVSCSGITPYISLWGGNPESGGAELSGGGYARSELTFSSPVEQANGQMKTSNSNRITIGRSTAAWGTWQYTAVMDAVSNGHAVFFAARSPAKTVVKGTLIIIDEGDLGLVVT